MDDNAVRILVEFQEQGIKKVGIAEDGVNLSKRAIENAMAAIEWISNKAVAALDDLDERPDEAEIEFGIKVEAEAGRLIGKASTEAHIKVRLLWRRVED